MSSILFFILVLAGVLISFVGGIIGISQSFSESIVWGLLYLFVPFASLVFLVKFWRQREWLRKSFFMGIGGFGLVLAGMFFAPSEYSEYAETNAEFSDFEQDLYTDSGNGSTAAYSASAPTSNNTFGNAINLATQASSKTQSAKTKDEWRTVAIAWQDSIALLNAVPQSDSNYATAQTKVAEYSKNLAYAQQNTQ